MTTQQELGGIVPEWTQGDYLRKARDIADLTVKQLAQRTGISGKSINNYEADRYAPRRPSLIAWALATGVSLEWLEMKEAPVSPTPTPPAGEVSARQAAVARLAATKRPHSGGDSSTDE